MNETVKALASEIRESFREVEIPPREGIVRRSGSLDLEADQIEITFGGRHWSSLTLEELTREADALFFFSPMGLLSFLPSYLLATVESYANADTIPGALVTLLSPANEDLLDTVLIPSLSLLSKSQAQSLIRVLDFLSDQHGEDFIEGELKMARRNVQAVCQGIILKKL